MDLNLKGTLLLLLILAVELCSVVNANLVLSVQRKFKGPHTSLSAIKAHDSRRRGRFLSAVDVELGGNGLPSATGFVSFHVLYFFQSVILVITHDLI